MDTWKLFFLAGIIFLGIKYRRELTKPIKDFLVGITPTPEELQRKHELKKAKVENGAFFDWNKFMRAFFVFILGTSLIIILGLGLFLVTFSQLSNQLLQDTDVSSSIDFATDIDMQFDGYFTKEITRTTQKVDPNCIDSFEYMELIYINETFEILKEKEILKDSGWSRYNGGKDDTNQNVSVDMFKKNLNDCERDIIEIESPGLFIPTNLTVNGISVSGNGTGNIGNLIGTEIFSRLSDSPLNWKDYLSQENYRWRNI